MHGSRVLMAVCALAVSAGVARAQENPELRGTVVSAETGDAVAGAWIALQGYDWGTFSWNDGHFFLPEIPGEPRIYEVKALGYEPEVLTLDPDAADLVVRLTPDAETLEGLAYFMDQVERRRLRGGQIRFFDREDLAFNGAFTLGDYLAQRGVRRIGGVCLDERPETIGMLQEQGSEFYLAEVVGGYLRLYTEEFVERAARERLELQRQPTFCSGPIDTD